MLKNTICISWKNTHLSIKKEQNKSFNCKLKLSSFLSKFFALLLPLVFHTLACSVIQRGKHKHERSEVQRIINYFIIYCQQQFFTSLNNKQLLSVWTTAVHKEVSQISLEITQLRTAYVPCSSLCDTSSSKRKTKSCCHHLRNAWNLKEANSKTVLGLKTTLTSPKEHKPQASEKRWQAPSSQWVGKHQEGQEEAGLGQQNKQAPRSRTQSPWIPLQPAITYTALGGSRWIPPIPSQLFTDFESQYQDNFNSFFVW